MKLLILPLIVFPALLVIKSPEPVLPADQAVLLAKQYAATNNLFGTDLLKQYADIYRDENIFFSPFSISSAVTMAGEGSKNMTKDEIDQVFHLPGSDSLRQYGFLGLNQLLNSPDAGFRLNTSNALWIDKREKLHASFTDVATRYYGAMARKIDFRDPSTSSQEINKFVQDKTNNLIKQLVSPSDIDPLTRLILTNTIYFKAKWQSVFDERLTREEPFTSGNGNKEQVKMMSQKGHYIYFENNDAQAVELPYEGGDLSMVVMLPKGEKRPADLDITDILAKRGTLQKVIVKVPKFSFGTSYRMKEHLKKLGMRSAFTDLADFSGISDTPLKIDQVIHKAFVEVNEGGTEAAAATAVVMAEITSVNIQPTKLFHANHPFVFVIRHNPSGALLFIGVVNKPECCATDK